MNDDDLKRLEYNAFRESMKDGVTETLAGFIFLMVSIMFRLPAFVGIFVVFYLLLLPKLVETFRQKHTYPRIGYVKLKIKESDIRIGPFLLLILIVVLLTGVATQILTGDIFNFYNWMTQITFALGLIMYGPSIYLVEKSGSKVYWLFGSFATILGLIVSYFSVANSITYTDSTIIYSFILGGILVIGGLLKLAYFLRAYPILDSQEDVVSE